MLERAFIIQYLPCKDCFCYVNPSNNDFKPGACIKFTKDTELFFSIGAPNYNLDKTVIGLNSVLAKELKLEEGETVNVALLNDLPFVASLNLVVNNADDYEVVECMSASIQSTLLNQINVVHSNQNIIVRAGNNICIKAMINNVLPCSPGKIGNLTEVVVLKSLPSYSTSKTISNQDFQAAVLDNFINLFHGELKNPFWKDYFKHIEKKRPLMLRLAEQTSLELEESLLHPFNAFISKSELPINWQKIDTSKQTVICSLSLFSLEDPNEKVIYIRLCCFEDFNSDRTSCNLLLNKDTFHQFGCKVGARALVQLVESFPKVQEIQINTKKNYLVNAQESIKEYFAKYSEKIDFVLNENIPFKLDNLVCSLSFVPACKFCVVDDDLVRSCKYSFNNQAISIEDKEDRDLSFMNLLEVRLFSKIVDCTLNCFRSNYYENVIITGKIGSGKSSLIYILREKLQDFPYCIYTELISCKNLKGKTNDSLLKVFTNSFSNLHLHQPSVLIIDDLEILCESVQDELQPNSIYFNRISEMLSNLFETLSNQQVSIIATTGSLSKLNKNIYSSRGNRLFKNHLSIEELTQADRKAILNLLLGNRIDQKGLVHCSLKSEGFVLQDLVDFSHKAVYEALKQDQTEISPEVLETALGKMTVLSLQDVNLHSPGDKDFGDVGGLGEVKKAMIETLLWPAKYPELFENAPLRLQSGMLLYGPPGSGKTLLAGTAAKQCNLRLISIKGPELLSKYIGASEQAVRDVFQKAQSAKPCILFFDEFDSLAPRRGHDNTGVTDRVVNQLLTQLDGVESLTGVCVLAATSRPDLLDPALLRPGRLDKQLFCSLPNKEERLEVLQVLAKEVHFEEGIDLGALVEATEGFSGADLQSLLYTAQLSSVDQFLLNNSDSDDVPTLVTQKHLEEALRKTRPSLSPQERSKYQRIYAKFQGGDLEDFKAGSKATLA